MATLTKKQWAGQSLARIGFWTALQRCWHWLREVQSHSKGMDLHALSVVIASHRKEHCCTEPPALPVLLVIAHSAVRFTSHALVL